MFDHPRETFDVMVPQSPQHATYRSFANMTYARYDEALAFAKAKHAEGITVRLTTPTETHVFIGNAIPLITANGN